LAEILAALSLVSDISRAQPAEEAMHACLVAVALGRAMGVSDRKAATIYYTTLLRSVGCTATSHEYAALYGDDMAVRGGGDAIEPSTISRSTSCTFAVGGSSKSGNSWAMGRLSRRSGRDRRFRRERRSERAHAV